MDTHSFIEKSIKIHGNTYDYSGVNYHRIDKQVEIICKIHGSFLQTPHTHLIYKSGCPQCSIDSQRLGRVVFSERAAQIHNNKYDYSNVRYVNNSTKVEITCPDHGVFIQSPANHLRGRGCQICANKRRGLYNKKSPDTFIQEASIVHSNKYDYSIINYITTGDKIEIICPTHGVFSQRPGNHLGGQGCPKCGYVGCYTEHLFKIKPELKNVQGILYLVEFCEGTEKFQKIGITKRSIGDRFNNKKDYDITTLHAWALPLYQAFQLEQNIIKSWKVAQYFPSTKIGGDSECFQLTPSQISNIVGFVGNNIKLL